MPDAVGTLRVDAVLNAGRFTTGVQAVKAGLTNVGGQTRATSAMLSTAGRVLGAFGVGFSLVGVVMWLKRAASASEEFKAALKESLAILPGLDQATSKEFAKTARAVAYRTKFSSAEIARSYFELISAGMTAPQAQAAALPVAQFAQAGRMQDLAAATKVLTGVQYALGLESADAAKNMQSLVNVSDALVKANTLAKPSVQEFADAIGNKLGAQLRVLNKDMIEGLAIVAAFGKANRLGAEAGTAGYIVLRDLQKAVLVQGAAWARYNIAVYDQLTGKMRNTADIVRDLEKQLAALSPRGRRIMLMELGFPEKSLAYIQELIGQGDFIAKFQKDMAGLAGTTEKVADNMTSLAKGLHKVKVAMGAIVGGPIGGSLDWFGSQLQQYADTLTGKASIRPLAQFMPRGPAQQAQRRYLLSELDKAYGEQAKGRMAERANFAGEQMREQVALLEKARDKTAKAYASLVASLRTPFEMFKDTYAKLAQLRFFKLIDLEQFQRGILQAAGAMKESLGLGYQPVAAIETGSQEYYTMLGQLEAANRTTDRITELIGEARRQTNLQAIIMRLLQHSDEDTGTGLDGT